MQNTEISGYGFDNSAMTNIWKNVPNLLDEIVLSNNATDDKLLTSQNKLRYPYQSHKVVSIETFHKQAVLINDVTSRSVVDWFSWGETLKKMNTSRLLTTKR